MVFAVLFMNQCYSVCSRYNNIFARVNLLYFNIMTPYISIYFWICFVWLGIIFART